MKTEDFLKYKPKDFIYNYEELTDMVFKYQNELIIKREEVIRLKAFIDRIFYEYDINIIRQNEYKQMIMHFEENK